MQSGCGDIAMRTLIKGGWVVGYNRRGHKLIPDGSVVFENDLIVYVGHDFQGSVDRTIDARGKLVSPGFINCHVHAAVNAAQTVFIIDSKRDYVGSNFIGYAAPRLGTMPPGKTADPVLACKYGMGSAPGAGATTILDVGTMPGGPDLFTGLVGDLAERAHLGPGFRSSDYRVDRARVAWDGNGATGTAAPRRPRDHGKQREGRRRR